MMPRKTTTKFLWRTKNFSVQSESVNIIYFLELFTILKPDNNKEENKNLISMLDTINDGYIDPFDWTTRLLNILRIQFKNDDEEAVENLVKAKQFSSQRLLVSSSS
jgi:hypothetical protein